MAKADPLEEIGIERKEVSDDVFSKHFNGFIQSFVDENYRQRIENLLKRESWVKVSTTIEKHLNRNFCQHWEKQSRPDNWEEKYNSNEGIYIANKSKGLLMNTDQASNLSLHQCEDAIFSINAGKLAIYLNHDWGIWYCHRT